LLGFGIDRAGGKPFVPVVGDLTLGQDLFITAADLAIAHSLAVYLRRAGETSPHWRLPEFAAELKMVAQNRRSVLNIDEDATGFDPDKHKGKVTVATIHRAKGLEWIDIFDVGQ
jgi:superfamily I DNA/RNA helicase